MKWWNEGVHRRGTAGRAVFALSHQAGCSWPTVDYQIQMADAVRPRDEGAQLRAVLDRRHEEYGAGQLMLFFRLPIGECRPCRSEATFDNGVDWGCSQ